MSTELSNINENLRLNVISNYLGWGFRVLRGPLVFRILYETLSKEDFGYWALLWSIFGYTLLLDFGFAVTVHKSVARNAALNKWDELNSDVSTILVLYCCMGAIPLLLGLAGAGLWTEWVGVSIERREPFGDMFVLFCGVMGLMFPLSIFPEILRGQQRIALVNWVGIASSAAGFVLICLAVWFKFGLFTIMAIALSESVMAALVCMVFAFAVTPQLRLTPRLFSRERLAAASRFSFVAYVIMLCFMVVNKSDLLVIGRMLSVSMVALYQPGSKVAETYGALIRQLAKVMQPAAAHLYAKGDTSAISKLLTNGIRYSALLATPLYLGSAFYLEWLVRLFTGEKEPDSVVLAVGHVLLLWSYISLITQNVYKSAAIMGGREKRLMWVGLAEAISNVGLSVVLVLAGHGLLGVAIGSIIPAFLVGWLVLWRWSAEEAQNTYWGLMRDTLIRTWLACIPLAATLGIGYYFRLLLPDASPIGFAAFLLLTLAIAMATIVGWGLKREERMQAAEKMPRPLKHLLLRFC